MTLASLAMMLAARAMSLGAASVYGFRCAAAQPMGDAVAVIRHPSLP